MKRHSTTSKKGFCFLLGKRVIPVICLGICILFSSSKLAAQKKPNFTLTDVTEGSDWAIQLKASGAGSDMDCWGTDTYSYTIYKNGNVFRNVNGSIGATPITVDNGIATGGSWSITYKTSGSLFNCHYWKDSNPVPAFTSGLKPPKNVVASDSASADALTNQIRLTWSKGTHVPNNVHHYRIYKDGDLSTHIAQVAGTEPLVWIDYNVNPGEKHTYSVITRVESSTWGNHVSDTITTEGSTFPRISASDGKFLNSVDITWPQMHSSAKSLKILRNGVEIHKRSDMSETRIFKDVDRIPGYKYMYTIIPYKEADATVPYATFMDTGFARPNGRIRGSVKAPFGGPVEGAIVYAERLTDVEQGDENPILYRDTTNANGLFEIRDIYYHEEATFKVYAEKGDHGFNPSSYDDISLDLSAPVYALPSPSFVDTSSFTIQGKIVQKLKGVEVAVENVEILVNNVFKGTKTDNLGNFSLTVEEIGQYTIKPRFYQHVFTPAAKTLQIENDVADVFFEDTEKDTLSGYFLGGCEIYIGRASLRIFNSKNPTAGIDTTILTNEGSGYYEIILPSRDYTIEVVNFIPDDTQNVTKEDVLNFFELSEVNLTENSLHKNYIYRKPPEIEIIGLPDPGCAPFDVPIVEQIVKYPLEIRVFESFGTESCLTSAGYVVIYDEISDGYDGPDTLQLEGGIAKYNLIPGEPNILSGGQHPYQKKIAIHANVDGQTKDLEQYTLVEGSRPREQTFTTVSPEVPFMILRDPPGDGSYSFLSKNTTTKASMRLFAKLSGSVKAWGEVKVGAKTLQGMGVLVGSEFWAKIKESFEVGAALNSTTEFGLSMTNVEEFNTSGNSNITGESGDLFVGSAMNIIYALTDVIKYDKESCGVSTSTDIIMGTDGFATTFMYTDSHIRNVLIPDLERLEGIYKNANNDSSKIYTNQIDVWRQTLERNRELKEKAHKINNRSFSAGSNFKSSLAVSTSASISLEYSLFIERSIAVEAGTEIAGNGIQGGVEAKFRMEFGGSNSLGIEYSRTTGFELKDDDIGDFFSVDIKADLVYGTPVFALVSGRSSCPWEAGTQPREGVQLTVDKKVQYDINQDAAAAFRLNLGNTSQSDEDRTYNLVFLQESNPEGAQLTLGGSEVQGGILTPYNILAGSSIDATVTVKRGPQSNAYQDLKFALLSDCDDGIIGDTVSFSVFFKSNCSPIVLSKPFNNWRVSGNDNNQLAVEVSGYDKTKTNNIVLQYRNLKFDVWESSTILSASELLDNKTVINWDITALEDGDYEIRAKLACGTDNSEYSFSDKLRGTIDRVAPTLFGVPEPSDGTYETGDEISATFDENLNCFDFTNSNVICKDKNSGVIYSVGVGCNGNKILIVPLTQENFQDQVMEISLLNIEDTEGNIRTEPIVWDFDIANADFKLSSQTDSDGDGIINTSDNCDFTANHDQADRDGDGIGDTCDDDIDGDGVANNADNCPYFANANQADTDGNGVGDVCEQDGDGDEDGVVNDEDNCPSLANGNQQDMDLDGIGDLCDDDRDGDGLVNVDDNCPSTPNPDQEDKDGDGEGDACHLITAVENELGSEPLSAKIQLYPNPASHVVNIVFELEETAHIRVDIIDLTSRQLVRPLLEESLLEGKYNHTFDVQSLNNGLYIIRISRDGVTQAKKLSIQK